MDDNSTEGVLLKGNAANKAFISRAPRLRTRLYQRSNHWFNRLPQTLSAVHQGCWLGFLSPDDVNDITLRHFGGSQFYTSQEHNLGGFLEWEAPAINRYFRKGSRVLVAGAGAGREVLALRQAGFEAEGFECSEHLVSASESLFTQRGQTGGIVLCDPDSVPSGAATYEGLVVGWGAYTHIPTRSRRVAFLQSLRQRALPHSPLLVSFFARLNHEKLVYRTAMLCRSVFRAREDRVEVGDCLEWGRYVHRFTRADLEGELKSAGFETVDYEEQSTTPHAIGISL